MPADRQVARMVSVTAGVLAAAASILPPAIYFSLSYQREAATVEAEAELNAQLITRIVTANPDFWRFEQARLSEYLARRPRKGVPEVRRLVDLDGAVLAESVDRLPGPWITRSLPLLDAGVRVGSIEISRSAQPLVFHTVLFVLVLLPVAFLAFQMLRTLPLQAIRRSERALRRQRDTAQRYLDVAEVAVVLLDARGNVSLVNRKGAEILARPVADVVGKGWVASFVEPPDRQRVARELAPLSRSDRVLALEHGVVRPSGERRIVSWYLTPMPSHPGGPAGLLVSGVDVTTERQLEEQLRQAQKMQAVGELASGVAHGFNNILASIKGYAAQIRRELPAGDPHLSDLDEILAGADRGSTLTRSLLAFSRQRLVAPEPADIVDVVRSTEPLLRSLLEADVDLRTSLPTVSLAALVEPLQLEQVLVNLVTNARDAMPNGGRVTVSVDRADLDAEAARRAGLEGPGSYVRVAVADTGMGIAPEVRPRVFEPFFTTKEVDKGTGLGLAIAYGIMKQHAGAIRVESEPGKGATFELLFPLLAEKGATAQPGSAEPPRAGTPTLDGTTVPQSRAAGAGRRDA
ncbi:MAG TPA: ATP-binding protein [Anaeromyxobacter sp.]